MDKTFVIKQEVLGSGSIFKALAWIRPRRGGVWRLTTTILAKEKRTLLKFTDALKEEGYRHIGNEDE